MRCSYKAESKEYHEETNGKHASGDRAIAFQDKGGTGFSSRLIGFELLLGGSVKDKTLVWKHCIGCIQELGLCQEAAMMKRVLYPRLQDDKRHWCKTIWLAVKNPGWPQCNNLTGCPGLSNPPESLMPLGWP